MLILLKSDSLWIKKSDGRWLCWDRLGYEKLWDVEAWADDIVEARIRGADSGPGTYVISAFAVTE